MTIRSVSLALLCLILDSGCSTRYMNNGKFTICWKNKTYLSLSCFYPPCGTAPFSCDLFANHTPLHLKSCTYDVEQPSDVTTYICHLYRMSHKETLELIFDPRSIKKLGNPKCSSGCTSVQTPAWSLLALLLWTIRDAQLT